MTILFSILGIHILNVCFLFFILSRITKKCGIENAHSMRFLVFLLLHPLANCIAILSIFINGEEALIAICKEQSEKD